MALIPNRHDNDKKVLFSSPIYFFILFVVPFGCNTTNFTVFLNNNYHSYQ